MSHKTEKNCTEKKIVTDESDWADMYDNARWSSVKLSNKGFFKNRMTYLQNNGKLI
jgi:hypothetical protein